jgi:tetratricopeptide (TPR) repeat protein
MTEKKGEDTNPNGINVTGTPAESGTRIDLGEDLLESTRAGFPAVPDADGSAPAQEPDANMELPLEEELANGEILFNEQIFGEAKKVLRRVLRRAPGNVKAKDLLLQIQNREIQELLSDNRVSQKLRGESTTQDPGVNDVIASLEKDLRLNLDKSDAPAVSLFADAPAEAAYMRQVRKAVDGLQPRDAMDMGIAHMEMGLYGPAKEIFEELIKYDEFKISGMYLLCTSLIHGGQCVEATIRLEPLVRDLTMPENYKADFLYLMGQAFESLGESLKAREYYRRVSHINPRYRDVLDKMR